MTVMLAMQNLQHTVRLPRMFGRLIVGLILSSQAGEI